MMIWCDNCGMKKSCPGYNKMPSDDCALFIPLRFNKTYNEDLREKKGSDEK